MTKRTDQYRQAEMLADLLNTLGVRIDAAGDLYFHYASEAKPHHSPYVTYAAGIHRWAVLGGSNDDDN